LFRFARLLGAVSGKQKAPEVSAPGPVVE